MEAGHAADHGGLGEGVTGVAANRRWGRHEGCHRVVQCRVVVNACNVAYNVPVERY
jgi:hypothetical protein